jgi:5-(carboxyamino)imidazole ribonucleotide synthase
VSGGAAPRPRDGAGAPAATDGPRHRPAPPLPPGSWLGLLGGGQLGRMFCMAAQSLGYRVCVLDPGADSPAGAVADRHLRADYLDDAALDTLARTCRAATTEFENVPARALERLARDLVVAPAAAAVAIAQDRIAEKAFVRGAGVEVAPYAAVVDEAALRAADPALYPGILKAARLGYDGKGQARVADAAQALAAFRAMGGVPCVLERRLALACELSVVVARGFDGGACAWPAAENVHRDGILAVSSVPARADAAVQRRATEATLAIAAALDYVGVLCVEFFVLADGRLVVNEMAPRPHNSGHYTIDACVTSQFEQQARALAGLPLGATRQHSPAVMLNLLGDVWFGAGGEVPAEPDWSVVLRHPQAKLHLYGKAEARRGRKMGHVTVLGETPAEAAASAGAIAGALGIGPVAP